MSFPKLKPEKILTAAVLLLVLAFFCWPVLTLGLGDDEGLLALEAQRLLAGELPGLDFACPYLGATVFYNAFWFLMLGQSLWALRVGLVVFFGLFAFGLFSLLRRFMPQGWVWFSLIALLSITIPLYPYLGANWNALIMALFSLLALLNGWVFAAGVLAGLAFVFKQTVGLYAGFAAYMVLVMQMLQPLAAFKHSQQYSPFKAQLGKIIAVVSALIIPAYLLLIMWPHFLWHVLLIFMLPVLVVLGGNIHLLWLRLKSARKADVISQQFAMFSIQMGQLFAGGLLALLIYFLPYIMRDGLVMVINNTLLSRPTLFLKLMYQDYLHALNPMATVWLALCVVGLVFIKRQAWLGGLFLLGAVAMLLGGMPPVTTIGEFKTVFLHWIYPQLPLFMLALGLWFYFYQYQQLAESKKVDPKDWLAVAVFVYGTLMFTSVYPVFAYPYVGCNIAFLGVFTAYLVYRYFAKTAMKFKIPLMLFALCWFVMGVGLLYRIDDPPYNKKLPLPYGGLWITSQRYNDLSFIVSEINRQTQRADDLYIFSDSDAELYFFTDHINPTRYNYYFFSLTGDNNDMIADLERHRVTFLLVKDPDPKLMFGALPNFRAYLQQHYKATLKLEEWLLLRRETPATASEAGFVDNAQ